MVNCMLVVDEHLDMGCKGVDGEYGEGEASFIYLDCLILLTCVSPALPGLFHHPSSKACVQHVR